MIPTLSVRQQTHGLCEHISGLSDAYVSLSDERLALLSAIYVALQEGLGCYPELSQEIRLSFSDKTDEPFASIYAELVQRVTGTTDGKCGNPALVHALYQQAICAPKDSYGKYGEEDWVYDTVFNAIDSRKQSHKECYDDAALNLLIDTFHILGAFKPEDKEFIGTVMTKWNEELDKDGWVSLPISDVVQRLRLMTAYYDLSHTDLMNPAAQSVYLLETFSDRIVKEGKADDLITYREALRNVFCYQTVHTEYFNRLEQAAKALPTGFASDILQGLLRIDRLEREIADSH